MNRNGIVPFILRLIHFRKCEAESNGKRRAQEALKKKKKRVEFDFLLRADPNRSVLLRPFFSHYAEKSDLGGEFTYTATFTFHCLGSQTGV